LATLNLKLAVNVVGEIKRKRTAAASRGFLATARLSCSALPKMLLIFCQIDFVSKLTLCTGALPFWII